MRSEPKDKVAQAHAKQMTTTEDDTHHSVVCSCVRYKSATPNQLSCMPRIAEQLLHSMAWKAARNESKKRSPRAAKQRSKWSIRETSYTISMYLFHLEKLECAAAREAGIHCAAVRWASTYVIPSFTSCDIAFVVFFIMSSNLTID